jgi:hypothetical protein
MGVAWRLTRAIATCVLAAYATALLLGNPFIRADLPPLGDFGSLYASGQAAAAGQNPYAVYSLTMNGAINLNPPASLLLFAPLSAFDPYALRRWWFIASVVAFSICVLLLARSFGGPPLRVAWAFASAPFWETVGLGQIYALLAVPSTVGWLLLERYPVLSGLLIGGVAAIKPNFLLWPVLLFLVGQRRAALASVGVFGALWLLAGVAFGFETYGQWLAVATREQPNPQVGNAALAGLLARAGLPALALPLDVLGALAVSAMVYLRRPRNVSSLALIALLVFSPLGWVGYGVFLLPLFFERQWTVLELLAAALLLIPRLVLQDAPASVGSAYTLAWLLLLIQQLRFPLGTRPPS